MSNGVAIFARQLHPHVCNEGLMTGEWLKDNLAGYSGSLSGVWMNEAGDSVGYFAGTFDSDSSGWRSFHGTVSGLLTTQVIAEFNGTWYYDDPRMCPICGSGHGQYTGTYRYLDGSSSGRIQGTFGYPSDDWDNHLPLHGTWEQFCPWVSYDMASAAH